MAIPPGQSKEAILKSMKKKAYEVKFDLTDTNYLPIENIGIGAYGVVCSAVHNKTKDRVAIKKIPQIFEDRRVATRTYREIKILKHFKHDNIIAIRDILKPKETMEKFRDVYVVFDLMESDLHRIIYSKQELSEEHVRYFLYQLLRGLKYIHSANVIHRDLKPSNLLVNEDCQLRIGDFGMARGVNMSPEEPNHFMTQYVATRWYRAPEIMLALIEYGTAVDMWSVGCIFAEMLGRKHLFPGKDYISQIKLIVGVMGSPSPELLKLCHSEIILKFISQLGPKTAISWNTLFPKASKKAVNLLSKMLVLHPGQRISVNDALKHLYLNKYHDPDDEPICVPTFNFNFEKQEMGKETLRELIYKEVMEYHEPRPPTLTFNACLKPVPKSTASHSSLHSSSDTVNSESLNKGIENTHVTNEFKQPSPKTDSNLAIVTTNLQSSVIDIEMLSARKLEDSHQDLKVEKVEEKKVEVKKSENKPHETTISSDTKALVKAALLNSNLKKQRSESSSEVDDKNKPVTAAQRQREREEKRRKKKEKAIERMKRNKDKKEQKPEQLLTDEDRELLQRWSKMQKANQPIAPKTEKPKPQNSTNQQSGVITSQNPYQAQQPGNQSGASYGIPLNQSQQSQCLNTNSSSIQGKSLIKVDTMHMLQQKLQARSGQNNQASQQSQSNPSQTANIPQSLSASTDQIIQNIMQEQTDRLCGDSTIQNVQGQCNDLSTIDMEGLKMLGLSKDKQQVEFKSVEERQNDDACSKNDMPPQVQGSDFSLAGQTFRDLQPQGSPLSNHGSPQKDYSNHSSPESYQSAASPDYYSNIESTHTPETTPPRKTSDTDPGAGFQHFNTTQNTQQESHNPSYFQQNLSTESISGNDRNSSMLNFQGQFPKDLNLPYTPVMAHSDQLYTQNIQGYQQSTGVPFTNMTQNSNAYTIGSQSVIGSQNTMPSRVTLPPPLSLGRQDACPGTSNSSPFTVRVDPDLISRLSKQFSKSQVEDPGPPALVLTPRGTGAGYGVGMDLDTLMIDAQDTDSLRPEPSPLSSSLLTDWMEVTGDLNIDMDALEQELSLQSPMSLSYNDLSLYHN